MIPATCPFKGLASATDNYLEAERGTTGTRDSFDYGRKEAPIRYRFQLLMRSGSLRVPLNIVMITLILLLCRSLFSPQYSLHLFSSFGTSPSLFSTSCLLLSRR